MAKLNDVYRSRKKMLFDNFLGGIFWSIGVWVGTTVIIALFLSKLNLVPIVGDFVSQVANYLSKTNSPFHF